MYSILLADDEEEVLEGMKIIIPWEEYGFYIKGTASDGAGAIELLKENSYDLVITDIRMPVINGLELIREIKRQKPSAFVLILSGYDEFSYAREGMQLGVKSYLLKPINESELIKELIDVRQELNSLFLQQRALRRYLGLTRDNYLYKLTHGKSTKEEKGIIELSFSGQEGSYAYTVVLLELEEFSQVVGTSFEDADLLLYAARNIAEEIALSHGNCYIWEETEGRLCLLFFELYEEREKTQSLKEYDNLAAITRDIIIHIREYLKRGVTAGIGSRVKKDEDIRTSFEEAQKALYMKFLMSDTNVIIYEQLAEIEKDIWDPELNIMELLEDIEGMKLSAVPVKIESMAQLMEAKKMPKDIIQSFSHMLTLGIDGILKKYKAKESQGLKSEKLAALRGEVNQTEQFRVWAKEYCLSAIQCLSAGNFSSNSLINQIIEYIDKHYMENINLKSLAGVFYLNVAYLGQLLKNNLGENFSDYLNKKRINEVKRMIILDNYKVYDAISKAGFQTTEYFYRQFKRYEKVSFAEFRKTLSRTEE